MKTLVKIISGASLVLCPVLKGETINHLLGQSIDRSEEEAWEYSARGGYVFEAEMDLVGDDRPEKMVWFSIDGYGPIYIFDSSSEKKYLGKLDRLLLGAPMVKESGKSTIFSVSDSGNHPNGEEEAFTKKVLSTVITTEGVETLERVAGVGPGEIKDKQFNEILNGTIKLEGAASFTPAVRFAPLRSYLNGEGRWAEFRQSEWVVMDSYLVHQDDVAEVRKIKSLSDENEIRALLGDFTKARALKLLGRLESERKGGAGTARDVRKTGRVSGEVLPSRLDFRQKQFEPDKKLPPSLPRIILGVLLAGIAFLVLKIWKGVGNG